MTTHLQLVGRSRIRDLYIHSPIRLHGVVLNQLSAGTTLPLRQLRLRYKAQPVNHMERINKYTVWAECRVYACYTTSYIYWFKVLRTSNGSDYRFGHGEALMIDSFEVQTLNNCSCHTQRYTGGEGGWRDKAECCVPTGVMRLHCALGTDGNAGRFYTCSH
jgi:hypothetical protein